MLATWFSFLPSFLFIFAGQFDRAAALMALAAAIALLRFRSSVIEVIEAGALIGLLLQQLRG